MLQNDIRVLMQRRGFTWLPVIQTRASAIGKRQGQLGQQDVVEITATGAMIFWLLFAETESSSLAADQIGWIADLNAAGGPKGEPHGCGE